MSDVRLTITVSDPKRFPKAIAEAREAGLSVTASYEDAGVVTGSITADRLPGLQRVPGIQVEPDREVGMAGR